MSADVQAAREAVGQVRLRAWSWDQVWHNLDDLPAHARAHDPASVLADCDDMLAALDDADGLLGVADWEGRLGRPLAAQACATAARNNVARVLAWAQRHGGTS